MIEAGVVIDKNGQPLFWHLPEGRTAGSLPDSRTLWQVLWDAFKEDTLLGFAHSHPGSGVPGPSYECFGSYSCYVASGGITRYIGEGSASSGGSDAAQDFVLLKNLPERDRGGPDVLRPKARLGTVGKNEDGITRDAGERRRRVAPLFRLSVRARLVAASPLRGGPGRGK